MTEDDTFRKLKQSTFEAVYYAYLQSILPLDQFVNSPDGQKCGWTADEFRKEYYRR
jgi:hypothetical protein